MRVPGESSRPNIGSAEAQPTAGAGTNSGSGGVPNGIRTRFLALYLVSVAILSA